MSNLQDPSSGGDFLDYHELKGHLLLITVIEETDEIETEYGPSKAIAANVVVLDGEDAGRTYEDALIFPRVLKSQLRKLVGGNLVVARLGQGEKKPGKNPAWTLTAATADEKALAQRWMDKHGDPSSASSAASQNRAAKVATREAELGYEEEPF